jgi:hypothetical protein
MKKLLFAAILLLGGLCAFGQNKAPANLVDVVVTNFTVIDMSRGLYVAPTSRTFNTAQHAFDAIDDKLGDMMLNSDDWDYLLGGTNTGYVYPQPVADWIDENWGIPTNGWLNLAPTNFFGVAGETTAADALNWIDSNWVHTAADIGVATDNFQFVGVAATNFWCPPTNVQRFADWIDDYGQYVESTNWQRLGTSSWPTNLPWLPVSAVLEWLDTNAMWGTNIFGQTYGTHGTRSWSGPRTLGFRAGRTPEGEAPSEHTNFGARTNASWLVPLYMLTTSTLHTAGGTVSVAPFNEDSATFAAPVTGEYLLSAQATISYSNGTGSAQSLGIGILTYTPGDATPDEITLANRSLTVGAGEVFRGLNLNFSSVTRVAAGDDVGLRVMCSGGWKTNENAQADMHGNPSIGTMFFSGHYLSR